MLPEFTQEHYKICFNQKKKKPHLSEHTNCIEFMKKKKKIKNNSPTWKIQMEVCSEVYLPGETLLDQQ